jgi:hypothetical protein
MTVYQRTPDGHWAAYDTESPLPRKLKVLLKAINGSAGHDVYVRSLNAFGDVLALLQSLARAGLIEDVRQPASPASASPAAVIAKIEPLSKASQAWDDTVILPGAGDARPAETAPAAESALPAVFAVPAVPVVPAAASAPDTALAQALEAMSTFVLTHLASSAFEVLPEIEAVTTLEDLGTLLGGYSQLVQRSGEPGRLHLARLVQLLEEPASAVARHDLAQFA